MFDPGDPDDGVTVTVPLAALNQLPPEPFEWLVPGFLREKVISLMKTMPKALRVKFVPVPENADRAIEHLRFGEGSLHDAARAPARQDLRRSDGSRRVLAARSCRPTC